jgi:predicted nuclease with TOPRIM domain
MTLLGKIFTGLVFALSLMFLALAVAVNATHVNWRDEVLKPNTGLKSMVEQASRARVELQQQLEKTRVELSQEQAARRTTLAALQTQLDQYLAQLQQSVAEVQRLESQYTELTQTVKNKTERLAATTQQNEQLKEQLNAARTNFDAQFAKATKLTDELNTLRGTLQGIEERNQQLAAQVSRFKEVTDAYGINVDDPIDRSPPDVNGEVLAVDSNRLVEISLGYDDGLREGHLLEVSRGGQYLGRVLVRKTEPNRAAAEILREYRQGLIKKGDRVDTIIE